MNKESYLSASADLIREKLGSVSIDHRALNEKAFAVDERKQMVADCANFFKRWLESDIERLINIQAEFTTLQAGDFDQVVFGRGTINGLLLIKELYEHRFNEYISNMKDAQEKGEDIDNASLFAELYPPQEEV